MSREDRRWTIIILIMEIIMISLSSIALIFIFSLGINKCELSGLCLLADIMMGIAAKEMIEFKVEQAIEDLKSVETE